MWARGAGRGRRGVREEGRSRGWGRESSMRCGEEGRGV
uniref:Uncharacterized protein n=1 Tax=Arundo donax TaxID=35708 RepID=A0A0A9A1K1_ARUDO